MEQNNKEYLARFGIFTKAVVYAIIGILTAMAAFNLGGKKSGSTGALNFLAQQSYGKVLLGVTVLGLLAYVFWRFYQTFADHENAGDDSQGIAQRLGYFSSGLIYGFIAYSAVKIMVNAGSGSGGEKDIISTLLQEKYGQLLVGVIGLILAGKAIYQFYRAYSGKFREKLEESGLDDTKQKILLRSGRIGFTARGIVAAIIAYLLIKAAWSSNAQDAGGKTQAFEFMQNQFGTIIMGVVALGLVAYAVFMFLQARYRKMNID
ncbi:MAG TPA: DUF1206 domain-containing protein [Leeuwenhoekiella sp.]|nr:DUF1206 domain-containing protein [Leeuwenhoekiella sp.]